jgi:hypothetical protein
MPALKQKRRGTLKILMECYHLKWRRNWAANTPSSGQIDAEIF